MWVFCGPELARKPARMARTARTGSSRAGLVFAHLSPGIVICLHLAAPVLHRYPWKLHWAQLLGIGLGRRNWHIRRSPPTKAWGHLPGPKDRSKYRETPSPSFAARKRSGSAEKSEGRASDRAGCGRELGKEQVRLRAF